MSWPTKTAQKAAGKRRCNDGSKSTTHWFHAKAEQRTSRLPAHSCLKERFWAGVSASPRCCCACSGKATPRVSGAATNCECHIKSRQ